MRERLESLRSSGSDLGELRECIRTVLVDASRELFEEGMPRIGGQGQLIRPLASIAGMMPGQSFDDRFWAGVLAVQLAHEASLLHDDIIDNSGVRRGEPTLVATDGVARALVHGDHLLTTAYAMAAATGSLEFTRLFARAVERTVAAEIEQAGSLGKELPAEKAERISTGKAGELFACALAAGAVLGNAPRAALVLRLGRRVGLLYQQLDDLLDYCTGFDTGKPTLGDFAQRRWTWPLTELSPHPFARSADEIAHEFRSYERAGGAPLIRCLGRVRKEADAILADARSLAGDDWVLPALIGEWIERAAAAVGATLAGVPATRAAGQRASAEIGRRVPPMGETTTFLGRNSRTFGLATRLLPAAQREKFTRLYAYCRITDDLVDRPEGADAETLLAEWMDLSRAAYDGEPVGLELLDATMADMRDAGVPFSYAESLAAGMRMDLHCDGFETFVDLRRYTYCVAGVVGQWLTRLLGVHTPGVLHRAARLGDAMQLTNIVRDVGEDLMRGRIYLPRELLASHGIETGELREMLRASPPVDSRFAALMEEMMSIAEVDYRASTRGIVELPRSAQAPIAFAAHLYRGIHRSVRRNRHDTLHRRAHTTRFDKAALALEALAELRRLRRLPISGVGPVRQTATTGPR